jgi:hypothetical protein
MNQSVLNRSRSDKFQFILELPKILKNSVDSVIQKPYSSDNVQFTCMGSPVPEIKIPSISVPFGGQVYHTSSDSRASYSQLAVKFFIDNGYQNYWILWKWLNLFNDSQEGTTSMNAPLNENRNEIILTNPITDFSSNFQIFALDEFNNRVVAFNYKQAFITGLSDIDYSYQEPNEILCTATFVFNQLNVELLKDVNVSSC